MDWRTESPADKKAGKYVLPENAKFGLVFISYYLENVTYRAGWQK